MYYRLPNKSIKKSELLKSYGHNESFLLDVDIVNNLVHTFCLNVNLAIEKMINKDVAELLKDLDVLFCNINIGRLASQLTNDYDIVNIKCMFEVLVNTIDLKVMRKNASNKFINLLFCLRKIEKKKA